MAEKVVYFAGGGSGGHIFPNMAVLERLREKGFTGKAVFCISSRLLDGQILSGSSDPKTTAMPLNVKPWTNKPWGWPGFLKAWGKSVKAMKVALEAKPGVVISTGGFVSGPPVVAASKLGLSTALVNLDAVPGRANQRIARDASATFSAYASSVLPVATPLGLPLRRTAVGRSTLQKARESFGLEPDRSTLLVSGGSQGAKSVNEAVVGLFEQSIDLAELNALHDWQVLHITGPGKNETITAAYDRLNVRATVVPFCNRMGDAWQCATLAIGRSGAGSVAEAWANAVPTLFLPYPFHRDQHQQHNAGPITKTGGAVVVKDQIDPAANAVQLGQEIAAILENDERLPQMKASLESGCPPDGAELLADWVLQALA